MSRLELTTAITLFLMVILFGSLYAIRPTRTERETDQPDIRYVDGIAGAGYNEFRDNANPISNFSLSSESALTFEDITFDASSSYDPNGEVAEYWYDFGDGSEEDEKWIKKPVVRHSYSDDGIYTIRLKVRDTTDAVSDWCKRTVTILNRAPVAIITANTTSVLTGEPVLLDGIQSTDPDGYVESYRFRFGPGDLSEWSPLSTYEVTYDMPGKYNLTMDVRDDNAAVNRSQNFTIVVLNRPPTAVLRVDDDANRLPAGVSVMFVADDSYDNDGEIISYEWSFGDGGYGENVGVTHVFSSPGKYLVELTVTDEAGGEDHGELQVRVIKNLNDVDKENEADEGPLGLSARVWFILIIAIIAVLIIVVIVIFVKRTGDDDGQEEMERALSHFYSGATASEEEEMRKRDLELMDSYAKTIPGADKGKGAGLKKISSAREKGSSGIDGAEEDDPFHDEKGLELSFKSPDHYKKKRGEKKNKKSKTPRSRSGKEKRKKVTSKASKKGTSPAKAGKKLVLPELPKLDIKKAVVKEKGSKENPGTEDAGPPSGEKGCD